MTSRFFNDDRYMEQISSGGRNHYYYESRDVVVSLFADILYPEQKASYRNGGKPVVIRSRDEGNKAYPIVDSYMPRVSEKKGHRESRKVVGGFVERA